MALIKFILIIQLSFLTSASQTTNQTDLDHVNVTKQEEEPNSDPYVHKLSGKCHFTFRIPENRSSEVLGLTADSMDPLVKQICQGLDCGEVYHVNTTSAPPGITCFSDCLYEDSQLKNCSQTQDPNCIVISEAVCGHHKLRLSGGPDRCAGRVELWRNRRWGTVCDDGWDLQDADVVCSQLDCGYAINVTGEGGTFSLGRGPIHLDELNCTGKEEHLWACPSEQNENDCGHKEDAGVVCSEMRAVRLTGGLDRCSGIVEIHRNGSWGTVCDNCWYEEMASIVCSMLQCGNKPKQVSMFYPPLPHNNGALWYYLCDKGMHSLWQCKEYVNKPHLCASSKAAGVICGGSLGFPVPTTVSPANVTLNTSTTEAVTTAAPPEGFIFLTTERLCTVAVCLLLLVFLITNTVLCCHYRSRHMLMLQQRHISPVKTSEKTNQNSYQDSVNLVKVTANATNTDVPPNPRYLWTQLSSVDSTSVDTDYEQYDTIPEPSAPLSTFRNSQRYKTDATALMKPSGLESLSEEGPDPQNNVTGEFTGCNGDSTDPQYARVSKISVDSFDTSSTSSEECYENTNNGYVLVSPEPEPTQSAVINPLNLVCSTGQHLPGPAGDQQSSTDEDESPIYSPVSPDAESVSEEDYDDVDCLP